MATFLLLLLLVFGVVDVQGSAVSKGNPKRGHRPVRPTERQEDDRLPALPSPDVRAFGHVQRPPRRKQQNPRELLAALGPDFTSEWMAIERPRSLVVEPRGDAMPPPHSKVWGELKKLNLTYNLRTKPGKEPLPEDSIAAIEHWLLGRTSCAVRFVWKDIGPLFWPRWIRHGECVDTSERPCSWPPGMHCVPAESSTLHVLRWHCRPAHTAGHRRLPRRPVDPEPLKCLWIRVPYPVTSECFCSC